jgi:hypothetical protein
MTWTWLNDSKNKKFARNISALLPKVLYLWIIIMRYWEQKIIIKLLHHNLKKKMSYVLKKKRKASIHTTRILKKKESVEKKSHNFLVQNFQKKKDLVVLPSTTNITILEVPPHTWLPPSFLGHAYQAKPKKLPKQTPRSICKCQKW